MTTPRHVVTTLSGPEMKLLTYIAEHHAEPSWCDAATVTALVRRGFLVWLPFNQRWSATRRGREMVLGHDAVAQAEERQVAELLAKAVTELRGRKDFDAGTHWSHYINHARELLARLEDRR